MPALSEMLAAASRDPEILAQARQAGATGITLAGLCCTANEILMRHGIPIAGSFLQQELAIVTGAVEMMIIDVQCCMPGLPDVARAYHTEVVSTSAIARTIGATDRPFHAEDAYAQAKALLARAIANFARRDPAKVAIPAVTEPLGAGFSVEAIKYMLGGSYRASFRPLNDAVIQGRIAGVAGIVGCNTPRERMDDYTNTLTRELLARNVLVLKTGCAAIASAKAGMLTPEAAFAAAGPGLREVCEAVGMPPVLHMGSCVDNSRLLEAAAEIVAEGGLGDDIAQVPVVGRPGVDERKGDLHRLLLRRLGHRRDPGTPLPPGSERKPDLNEIPEISGPPSTSPEARGGGGDRDGCSPNAAGARNRPPGRAEADGRGRPGFESKLICASAIDGAKA